MGGAEMKKFFKNCLIVAVILIAAGALLVVISSIWGGTFTFRNTWDNVVSHLNFNNDIPMVKVESAISAGQDMLDSVQSAITKDTERSGSVTPDTPSTFHKEYEIYEGDLKKQPISSGQVTNIMLEMGNCELYIEKSTDDTCYLEVKEGDRFQFYQEGETLYVKTLDSRVLSSKWWNFDSWDCEVRVWLPEGVTYQEAYIEVGAGSAEIDELSAQNLTIKVGAGAVKADSMTADELYLDIGAGAVKAEHIRADYLNTKVGAGSVKINQMEVKDLEAQAEAGNFHGEGSLTGNAKLNCSVGNIELELDGEPEDYNYTVSCSLGSVHIGSEKYSGLDSETKTIDNGSDKNMDIDCSVGTVKIKF
jgi:hypothetical protein